MSNSSRVLGGHRTKGIQNRGTQVYTSKLKYNRLTVGKKFNCQEGNMSGGHFKYAQSTLREEASSLSREIRLNKQEFPEEVLETLRYTLFIMESTVLLMDEADWLFSGNITEDSFKEGSRKCKKDIITHQD
tara:strand:- start:717 stop:1109 length:393 start_codon:yes stop_codon:yes gene_type:complete